MPANQSSPLANQESPISKPGYQLTKLGWLPEEWVVVRIGEVTSLLTNGFVGKSKDHYVSPEEGVLYIQGYNVNAFSFDMKGVKYVSQAFHEKNSKSCLQEHDLLIVQTGDVGLTAKVTKELAGSNCHALIVTRFNQDRVDPNFQHQFLNSPFGRAKLKRIETGSTMKHLNVKDIKKSFIPLPPLPEQTRIANLLTTWDRAITTTQQLLDALETRKRGLMQQLLTGEVRLPGFVGEWEEVKLGEITTRVTKKNTELNDNVVTISAQRGFVRQEDFFKKRVASKTLSGYYLLEKGQFAYNKSYSNGYPMGAFKRLDDFDKGVVTTLYICFSVSDEVNSDFLLNYFEGGRMINSLTRVAQEGGRAHGLLNIGLKDFFSLKLTLPSKKEQDAIATILTAADREITLHREKLESLKTQKRGLMQLLLTGQKRLSV